jgi:hypothetical protein
MATKAGVWIDHKQAIVVLATDAGQEIKEIKSGLESPARPTNKRSNSTHTPNDFVAEDRLERKVASRRKKYYDEVVASIRGATGVLILGPGEAKGEFSKNLKSKKVGGVVELETADKMTVRQLAARVKLHFATKVVAPKKTAKKPVKATAGKPSKKAVK